MAPEVYPWLTQQGSSFAGALSTFQSKLQDVRAAYPGKLLCPIFFPVFFINGAIHDRASAGASCPADTTGNHEWAPYATFDRAGNPICNYTPLSNSQVQQFLDMFFNIGCDGIFLYSDAGREHGAYWTDSNRAGIRTLLTWATTENGAEPDREPHCHLSPEPGAVCALKTCQLAVE